MANYVTREFFIYHVISVCVLQRVLDGFRNSAEFLLLHARYLVSQQYLDTITTALGIDVPLVVFTRTITVELCEN